MICIANDDAMREKLEGLVEKHMDNLSVKKVVDCAFMYERLLMKRRLK